MQKIQCKIAKSLGGGFAGTPNEVWGTVGYKDRTTPTVFFGLYDVRDYIALLRHKGKCWILWAGGDLNNLDRGFILNNGKLRWISKIPFFKPFLVKLLKKAENWVENEWEANILKKYGIEYQICPSFLGDIKKYKITYKPTKNPSYYLSANVGRENEYGWRMIENKLAIENPDVSFHLYGSNKWQTKHKNVIIHGKVSQEQMDKETSKMTGAMRLNMQDGFSEILAKSILWGQYPISIIAYPFMSLLYAPIRGKTPNIKGREYYLKTLNQYPFNVKIHNKQKLVEK